MYLLNGPDHLTELSHLPQSDVGAPCPVIFSEEHCLVLSYWMLDRHPNESTGSTPAPTAPCAFIRFLRPYFHSFGPPNDEALEGHPLASRGLHPYSVYQVECSSLIRHLEAMNCVHPYHQSARFKELTHFLFTFHDSTFECVAHRMDPLIEYIHSDAQYDPILHHLQSP